MKKVLSIVFVLMIAGNVLAQKDSVPAPPFRRFPSVPPLNLLKIDSVSVLNKSNLKKNTPVLIMLFNPTCDHCQHETEQIIKNIDAFKKVQIILATTAPFGLMKEFYANYKLAKFKNISVGQDFQYTLPSFYMIHSLPYLAMYDKQGKLLTTFEGTMKIEDLIQVFK
jgi:thioredoxin-related protein